jgi:hypothetical protein
MALSRDEEKPWKTNLARKSAQRREQVLHEVEEVIKKAPSFEEALRQSVELMKKKFARYSAITGYVADGEDLAVHVSLDRPQGPDRVWSGGPLAGPQGHGPGGRGPVPAPWVGWAGERQRHGLARAHRGGAVAILEVWSDFRDAFTPHDVKLLDRVSAALGRKTPAA